MRAYFNGEPLDVGGASAGSALPPGVIVIWSGMADQVPAGWHICDGTDGTPDLRGRFVLGSSEEYAVGATGGEKEVTLTVEQMPSHGHKYSTCWYSAVTVNRDTSGQYNLPYAGTLNTDPAGGSQPHNNMPPYYALCYIMKM